MGQDKVFCQSLHTYPIHDEINRFVNVGSIKDSSHIFECGTIVNGVSEVKAFINADGTCSFINSNATTFTGLSDAPHTYSGHSKKVLTVGEDENCVRFNDSLTLKEITADSVKTEDLTTGNLAVDKRFKVDLLEVNRFIQNGSSTNHFYGSTEMDKTRVNYLTCMNLTGNTGNISGDLSVEGDFKTKLLRTKGLMCEGNSVLGNEVYGTNFVMDSLQCDRQARINSVDVGTDLRVFGKTNAQALASSSIINTGNFESNDVKSITGRFNHLTAETLEADSIKTKSELVFGKVDYPQIFTPNEKTYIDVEFPLKGLRGYGYGFTPTQALDTILVKIKTNRTLESSDFKIGFKYYNTKDTTPSVYKLGEVLYPVDDYVLAVVKLSGNLPTAPYWVLTVDVLPF